ncbi:MAG TPA: glycoside hydrolase family 88 protein [Pyrinomonadaceae bacterium]|nr:glycoside hydrolase family 88 protein [Pyrinomonadaceae bacterium]
MRTTRVMAAILLMTFVLAQATIALPGHSRTNAPRSAAATDWSKAMVESTMKRFPTAQDLGSWGYAKSLYLYGSYLVWRRTGDKRYLQYLRDWVDSHIDGEGNFFNADKEGKRTEIKFTNLDSMYPGNLVLVVYQETKEAKYKIAADKIRKRFDTYKRTSDGGFWHAESKSREWQLWADGVWMALPFLIHYGQLFGDSTYANAEVTKQMLIYYKHLNDQETGLLWHAYDESGSQNWADPKTHHSGFHWGRAFGWYAMTLIELLEILPKNQPQRAELIAIINQLAKAFEKYQDPQTRLWYQIVDKGGTTGNWLETSSSSMYTYMMWMGVKRGYLPKNYETVALKGYQGVLSKLTMGADGLTRLVDVCEGTNVADLAYYFGRKRPENDFHGLGAFLIMNEQLGAAALGHKPKPVNWKAD